MRRRGIPRIPPIRRLGPPRPEHPRLRLAIQLFNNGRYLEAADLFEKHASSLEAGKRPNAHHLYIFAARARSMGGDEEMAKSLLQKGLGLLIRDERWSELQVIGDRVMKELSDRNRTEIENEIRVLLSEYRNKFSDQKKNHEEEPISNLPTHCPSCGAPIYGVGIEWLNNKTALCQYCGSVMKVDK